MMSNARVLAIFTLALSGCSAHPSLAPADDLYPFRTEQLAPRVHLLTQGNEFHIQPRGNVAVIEQSSGVVLVDSGGSPAAAEQVIGFVRARTRKPVTALVLTHWHGDHVLGVSRLLEQWPDARVISTPATRDALTGTTADRYMPGNDAKASAAFHENVAGALAYLEKQAADTSLSPAVQRGFARAAREYAQFAREMQLARRVAPKETFSEKLILPDPQIPVEVHFFGRANTEGDAIAWLPRQRVVITGDVVVAPIPFGFDAWPAEWIDVLKEIRRLDYAVLAPGHGSAMRGTAYLDRLVSMLADVRAKVAPWAGTALDFAGAAAHVDLQIPCREIVGDDEWLQRWCEEYWKKPIVASALREAPRSGSR